MKRKAIFPGSFDPITNGHLDLITRARALFSEVVVAVASDTTGKQTLFSLQERQQFVVSCVKTLPGVEVKTFSGLLIQFCEQEGAQVIIRGIRNGMDFDYEYQMAQMNRKLNPRIETIFLPASAALGFVSGTLVREISRLGGNIEEFVPVEVREALSLNALQK